MSRNFPAFPITSTSVSHLQSASSPVYNSLSALTVATWVKMDSIPAISGATAIIAEKNPLSFGGGSNNFTLGVTDGLVLVGEILSANGHVALSEVINFPMGKWIHLAMIFDFNGSQKIRFFTNGVEVIYALQFSNMVPGDVPPDDSGDGWWIGADGSSGTSGIFGNVVWTGEIAEFALWNRSLASTEISQLAVSQLGVPQAISTGLVGYWHLCGLSNPEPDASASGNPMNVFLNSLPAPDSPGYMCGKPGIPVGVTQNPSDQIVSVGQTATFTTNVVGGGIATYQWQTTNHRIASASGFVPLPGAGVDGFWNINGATSSSYTTPTLQASDNGTKFMCLISGSNPVPQAVSGNVLGTQQLSSSLMTKPATLQVH